MLGKPATPFFEAALRAVAAPAPETLMVGDDIRGDLQGDLRPDGVIDSIADLPHWWAESASAS